MSERDINRILRKSVLNLLVTEMKIAEFANCVDHIDPHCLPFSL